MTLMERQYQIPLLAGEEFNQLDNTVKWLYLELSNARDFLNILKLHGHDVHVTKTEEKLLWSL